MALVIGYGNPLRGDDAIGWHVAEMLRASGHTDVEIRTCHQLMLELAEPISRADRVVFVDAREGPRAGEVCFQTIELSQVERSSFSHHVSPGQLLLLARELYGACPPAWVVSVTGVAFEHGGALSPAVSAATAAAARQVSWLIDAGPR